MQTSSSDPIDNHHYLSILQLSAISETFRFPLGFNRSWLVDGCALNLKPTLNYSETFQSIIDVRLYANLDVVQKLPIFFYLIVCPFFLMLTSNIYDLIPSNRKNGLVEDFFLLHGYKYIPRVPKLLFTLGPV